MPTVRRRSGRHQSANRRSPVVNVLIIACSVLVSMCIAFGNPTLWSIESSAQTEELQEEMVEQKPGSNPLASEQFYSGDIVVTGEYKAISQSDDASRVHNIELAAKAIDGETIQPGETFSFNSFVGDTSNDERYEVAPVIFGSEISYERGGGICQVSTALYMAALKADLDIVERHPHSMVVDYAPIGLDATLNYGEMDLRITNSSNSPVEIVAVAEGQMVTVRLLGSALETGLTIDASSKVKKVERLTQKRPSSDSSENSVSEVYTVESYRIYYKDGIKVNEELLAINEYVVNDSTSVSLPEGGFDPAK